MRGREETQVTTRSGWSGGMQRYNHSQPNQGSPHKEERFLERSGKGGGIRQHHHGGGNR